MKDEKQKKLIVALGVITAVWAGFAAIGLYGRYGKGNPRSVGKPLVVAETLPKFALPQVETPSVEGVYVEESVAPKGFDPAGIFTLSKNKVGDVIRGMRIVSIGVGRFDHGGEPNLEDLRVVFSGEKVLTGRFFYRFDDWSSEDQVGFSVDGKEREKLPRLEGDMSDSTGFCFSNPEDVKNIFGPDYGSGTATIVVDEYKIIRYPSESTCEDKFVKLISIKRDK